MAAKPKLRIFAGPNGSGKTTLFESIQSIYFSTKFFINADLLEDNFKRNGYLNLSEFELSVNSESFEAFCINQGLYKKAGFDWVIFNLAIVENVIVCADSSQLPNYNSYHFAIIADFIRYQLIGKNVSFSFETVFSHPSKLELIDFAHKNNYKVYLYFIGTETPVMNLERVKDRVKKGGHFVDEGKIAKRYFLTMELLHKMIKQADETYLWDNSGLKHKYIGNIKKGYFNAEQFTVPNWVNTYILSKV